MTTRNDQIFDATIEALLKVENLGVDLTLAKSVVEEFVEGICEYEKNALYQ